MHKYLVFLLLFTAYTFGQPLPNMSIELTAAGTLPATSDKQGGTAKTNLRMCTGSEKYTYCVDEKAGVFLVRDLDFSNASLIIDPRKHPEYFFINSRIPVYGVAVDNTQNKLYLLASASILKGPNVALVPSGNRKVDSHRVVLAYNIDPLSGTILPCPKTPWCDELLRFEQNSYGHAGGGFVLYPDLKSKTLRLLIAMGDNSSVWTVPDGGPPAQDPATSDASVYSIDLKTGEYRLEAFGVRNAAHCNVLEGQVICTNIGWENHESIYRIPVGLKPPANFCWGQGIDGAYDTTQRRRLSRDELIARACMAPAVVMDREAEKSVALASFFCSAPDELCVWADVVTGKLWAFDYAAIGADVIAEPIAGVNISLDNISVDSFIDLISSVDKGRVDPRLFSLAASSGNRYFAAVENTGEVFEVTINSGEGLLAQLVEGWLVLLLVAASLLALAILLITRKAGVKKP